MGRPSRAAAPPPAVSAWPPCGSRPRGLASWPGCPSELPSQGTDPRRAEPGLQPPTIRPPAQAPAAFVTTQTHPVDTPVLAIDRRPWRAWHFRCRRGVTGEVHIVRSFMRVGLLVAAVIGLLVVGAGGASAQSRPSIPPVRADVITEVLPTGAHVVAVAIKYSRALDSRTSFNTSAFSVTATIKGVTAPRTVTDVYPNTSARVDTAGHDG